MNIVKFITTRDHLELSVSTSIAKEIAIMENAIAKGIQEINAPYISYISPEPIKEQPVSVVMFSNKMERVKFRLYSIDDKIVGYELWDRIFGWCYSANGFAWNGHYIPHVYKVIMYESEK